MPQLNLNMVYARETELPLYYRELPGSVPDIVTITTTAGINSGLGLKNYSFALDRGFFSEENLWYFHDNRLGFTIGVPLEAHGTARRLLEHCRMKLHAFNSTISFGETTLNHTSAAYAFTRKNPETGKKESFRATAHIYRNRIRQAEEERQFQELLNGIMRDFSRTELPEMDEAEQWLAGKIGKSRLHKKSRVIYEVIAPGLLKQHGIEPGEAAAVARKALAEGET